MSQSGFNRGYNQGRLQGVKTGLGMARRLSGYKSGTVSGTVYNKEKVQDPVLLASARNDCPFFYWNADNMTLSGTNVTAVTNLLGTYNPLTQSTISSFTVASDPLYVSQAVNNNRAAITFDSNDAFGVLNTAVPNMTNTDEMTLMMVCRVPAANGVVLFCKTNESLFPGTGTSGDLIVESLSGGFEVTFVGNTYSSTNYGMWTAGDAKTRRGDWVLLTIKARLKQPNGVGSEIEIYVNSTKNMVNTFGPIDSFTGTTWQNSYIVFGNGTSFVNGGGTIAAGLITEEWVNESLQLRLENYFRDYYAIKF
jgi:hypothetical protein